MSKAFEDAIICTARRIPDFFRNRFVARDKGKLGYHVVKEEAVRCLLRHRSHAEINHLMISLLYGGDQLNVRCTVSRSCCSINFRRRYQRGFRFALHVFRIPANLVFFNLQLGPQCLLPGGVDATDGVGGDPQQRCDHCSDQHGTEQLSSAEMFLSHGLDLLDGLVRHGEITVIDLCQGSIQFIVHHAVMPSSSSLDLSVALALASMYLTFPSGKSSCVATSFSVWA